MSTSHFIPEVWAASIMENLHDQAVLTGMANREYEGQLTTGSTIHIPGIVDVKVKDYKKGVVSDGGGGTRPRTTAPDTLSDTGLDLVVDQEKSFDFLVDDIDRAQSRYSFDAYTRSAATGLVEDAETFLTAPTDWATAYDVVLGLRGLLTDAKVPQSDRTLLVNAAFERFLLSDGSKLTAFDKSNTTDGLREATIGRLIGFDVVTTPWLDNAKPTAIGLWKPALAYVSQIDRTEGMRAQDSFADRVRGLHVYGGGVLRPTAVQVFKAA